MKKAVFSILTLVCFCCSAQEYDLDQYLFVRIYDATGKKIHKGELLTISDEGLRLEEKDSIVSIPVASIGEIRTKHSFGGKVLIGSIVGASFGLGIMPGDPETERSSPLSGEERIAAVTGGALIGGLLGVGIGLLQKRGVYTIDGEASNLQVFVRVLQE